MIFEKEGSKGGDSGVTFNDGVNDCVRKVIVGEDSRGVAYIKIEYGKDENIGKNGAKLGGFHGRSYDVLDAIGAYFVSVSYAFKQLTPQGGYVGDSRNDGAYDGVRKVRVGKNGDRVSYVEFEYYEGEKTITHSHGKKPQAESKKMVSSGKAVGTKFVLVAKGLNKLVGFQGRSTSDHIGAHFAVELVPPIKKLEGARFNLVEDEYITSVEGFYCRRFPNFPVTVKMLRITTNRQTSQVLGHDPNGYEGTKFVLDMNDHKIVGFHGRSSLMLEQIGVYVKPIDNT
ncbi:unnamed protein product [Arabis nemorensis]|uniref:Jacalin-type lectin domain-containing protein n=1 Tax=Arabis nemorensis TaxID=586526 RepID=A0A565CEU0_9BRAS|nr:unnamed protein product [Arabis nemorensis]